EQRFPERQLRVDVLRHQQQVSRRQDLQQPAAMVIPECAVVRERKSVWRVRQRRWHTEQMASSLAETSRLRRLLAVDDRLSFLFLAYQHSRADHHWLLRRWATLGTAVREGSLQVQLEGRALPAHWSLGSFRLA